jgi:hypothetical protein
MPIDPPRPPPGATWLPAPLLPPPSPLALDPADRSAVASVHTGTLYSRKFFPGEGCWQAWLQALAGEVVVGRGRRRRGAEPLGVEVDGEHVGVGGDSCNEACELR